MIANILRGTKRNPYSSSKVRKMRSERMMTRAKKDGVSNDQVQHYLGKLQAAGHMRLGGMVSFDTNIDKDVFSDGRVIKTNIIKFSSMMRYFISLFVMKKFTLQIGYLNYQLLTITVMNMIILIILLENVHTKAIYNH